MSVEILDLAALALTAVFFALLYYLHKKKHVDFGVRTILAVRLFAIAPVRGLRTIDRRGHIKGVHLT